MRIFHRNYHQYLEFKFIQGKEFFLVGKKFRSDCWSANPFLLDLSDQAFCGRSLSAIYQEYSLSFTEDTPRSCRSY